MRTKSLCDSCSVYGCVWRVPVYNGIPALAECHNYTPKPQTKADRLRAMTDEELAEWIAGDVLNLTGGSLKMATEAWCDWLRQEAEE